MVRPRLSRNWSIPRPACLFDVAIVEQHYNPSNMLSAVLMALGSAAFGAVVTYVLGAPDRKLANKALQYQESASRAQQELARLEAEREQRTFFDRFVPRHEIVGMLPDPQSLCLVSDESFTVEGMDYLNATGAIVGTQQVGKTDTRIHIPLRLDNIVRIGPWTNTYDRSAELGLRVHIQIGQFKKEIVINAMVQPTLSGSTMYYRVIG